MKKKIFVVTLPFIIFSLSLFISRLFLKFITDIHYLCPIKLLSGFYCPGCGCTRAVHFLLRFDLLSSLRSNPSILLMCIAIALWYSELLLKTFGKNIKLFPRKKAFYIVLTLALTVFYVIRNFIPVLEPSWSY
ncbi:DUF2752 domain-containing protein [Ruminococcus sp. HUN007]|uniref:DUF2752 domain-containing protein n=1 Tax=Ruminococcus sp. HUN007 TaxID=1514668 RepID=UPI0005D1A1CC|nr:DUF2752 domain-containing protein [Ruminococcus sp. HUN007]